MIKKIAVPLFAILMLTFSFSMAQTEVKSGQKAPSLQQSQEDRSADEGEVIVPAPTGIKQAASIYVFLGWVWLSIGILIFLLRLKIKEVDRLHQLGFFSEDKNVPE